MLLTCFMIFFSLKCRLPSRKQLVCDVDARRLSSNFVVNSAYGDKWARGVSLLAKPSLVARVDLVHPDVGRDVHVIVTAIAVSSG